VNQEDSEQNEVDGMKKGADCVTMQIEQTQYFLQITNNACIARQRGA